jgi:carbon-monoxide dehydrogenase medium subunit
MRLARHAGIVDLAAIEALNGVRRESDALVIGATTPHADVAASDEVNAAIPALASLAEGIGDPLVRNRGTLGGSIAHADPAADYPAGVLGLGATVMTNRREVAADAFFVGLFATALEPGEIVTGVRFPIPRAAAYCKYPQPASRFALAGVFVARTSGGVRVAVTGAGPCAFRFGEAERALEARFDPSALDGVALPADELNSDIHASAEYRAHCVVVLAKRAVASALSGEG